MEEMSLTAVAKMFSDEPAAWLYVEKLRWNGNPVCALCGSSDVLFLQPRTDTSRLTKTGKQSLRRVCVGVRVIPQPNVQVIHHWAPAILSTPSHLPAPVDPR